MQTQRLKIAEKSLTEKTKKQYENSPRANEVRRRNFTKKLEESVVEDDNDSSDHDKRSQISLSFNETKVK